MSDWIDFFDLPILAFKMNWSEPWCDVIFEISISPELQLNQRMASEIMSRFDTAEPWQTHVT